MHFIFGLPYLLVVTRFILPLQIPLIAKICAAVFLLVGSQMHLWNKLSSGSVFSPEYPRMLVVLFNWAFGATILLALLQLMLDVVSISARLVNKGFVVPDAFRFAMAASVAVVVAIAVMQAIRVPPIKDVEVRIRNLPLQFDGYRILQLTDLHISKLFPASWTERVVERSNALGVDIMLITGDLIDGTLDARRADVHPLRGLKAPDGIYMIPGNHEYYFGYREWINHYATMGMRALENQHAVIQRGDDKLVVAGVTEPAAAAFGLPLPDTAKAIAGAPTDSPVILLDHQPGRARQAAQLGVDLQLSGHTHGGMVIGLDMLAARANGGYVSGAYQVGPMTLYVNNGTALWPGFAMRLGRPSELTRITLRRG